MMRAKFLVYFTFLVTLHVASLNASTETNSNCKLPDELEREIDSYGPVVKRILSAAVNGSYKGTTWQELAHFVDKFGPRLCGSKVLEDSIDYMLGKLKDASLDNVHGEVAKVPHWVRLV